MYKTTVYTEKEKFTIETEGKVTSYQDEDLIYLQDESCDEIFVVNVMGLIAIHLNCIDETKEVTEKLSESIKEQLYNKH